ncbi:MAG: NifB/NifX family molybdenum-iron cluster-binding protein [Methanospirillum sp.]
METDQQERTGDPVTERKRFAIAREGEAVAPHLGRSTTFAVYECADGRAVRQDDLENLMLSPGFVLVFFLRHGIDTVIAGNSGGGLCALLERNGIEVVRGVEGSVEETARAYAAGTLARTDVPCTLHDACSGCGNCS